MASPLTVRATSKVSTVTNSSIYHRQMWALIWRPTRESAQFRNWTPPSQWHTNGLKAQLGLLQPRRSRSPDIQPVLHLQAVPTPRWLRLHSRLMPLCKLRVAKAFIAGQSHLALTRLKNTKLSPSRIPSSSQKHKSLENRRWILGKDNEELNRKTVWSQRLSGRRQLWWPLKRRLCLRADLCHADQISQLQAVKLKSERRCRKLQPLIKQRRRRVRLSRTRRFLKTVFKSFWPEITTRCSKLVKSKISVLLLQALRARTSFKMNCQEMVRTPRHPVQLCCRVDQELERMAIHFKVSKVFKSHPILLSRSLHKPCQSHKE